MTVANDSYTTDVLTTEVRHCELEDIFLFDAIFANVMQSGVSINASQNECEKHA